MYSIQAQSQSLTNANVAQSASTCCSRAKVQRFALLFFAAVIYITGLCLGGALLVSTAPFWQGLGVMLISAIIATFLKSQSDAIVDPTNIREMTQLREVAARKTYEELVNRFSIETILKHEIVSREVLREKFLLAAQVHPLSFRYRQHAETLFQKRLINLPLLVAFQRRDENEIRGEASRAFR